MLPALTVSNGRCPSDKDIIAILEECSRNGGLDGEGEVKRAPKVSTTQSL